MMDAILDNPQSLAWHVGRNARSMPDRSAFIEADQRLNWADYDLASDWVAMRLIDAGFVRGDRVGVLLPDGALYHIVLLGIEKAGLIALGLGARAGQREIVHLMSRAEATGLICQASHRGRPHAELVEALGLTSASQEAVLAMPDDLDAVMVAARGAAIDRPAIARRWRRLDEIFLLNSTSGTTGMPKCVAHDQMRWLHFSALACASARLSGQDIFMAGAPMPFGFGLWTSHITPALLGAPCIKLRQFDARGAMALIDQYQVTVLAAVSTQFMMILNGGDDFALDSLRILYTGGEAVPQARAAAFERRTGAHVLQFYGSNESGAFSYTCLDDPADRRLSTAGRVIPQMQVRLFDETGRDVTGSGRGRPAGLGPLLSRGYFNDAEANARLFTPDGWMLMDDIVEIDPDGYLRVVGRVGDFIIRGGKNISTAAIEEAVAEHPRVSLAAVVARPDPLFGERAAVFVETRDGAPMTLDELVTDLRRRHVSPEIFPEYLIHREVLPRASGGKVAKGVLKAEIMAMADVREAGDP